MAHRLAAVGVTAIMILLALIAAAPTHSAATSPASTAAAVPAIPVIHVRTTNYQGFPKDTFEPGSPYGRVYFDVTDPADDSSVAVKIYDTNASRDGLTNPVASWTVNASTGTFDSWITGIEYTIPTSVAYGGNWNISVSGALGGNATHDFVVTTYTLWAFGTPVVMPGQTGTFTYFVNSTSGGRYTEISTVNVSAVYLDGDTDLYAPLHLSADTFAGAPTGSATFLLPLNASSQGEVFFNVWANVSSDGLVTQFFNTSSIYSSAIATFYGPESEYYITDTVGGYVLPGQLVGVTVEPVIYSAVYGFQYGPNITSYVSFVAGTTPVPNSEIPGSPPTKLISPPSYGSYFTFVASSSLFSSTVVNGINVSTVAEAAPNGTVLEWWNVTIPFYLAANGTAGVAITGEFNAGDYVGGQTADFNWSLVTLSGTSVSGWSGQGYAVSGYGFESVPISIANGYLSGTSGTISFTVPTNFYGTVWLTITAQNGSSVVEGDWDVEVGAAVLLLAPTVTTYSPGESFAVDIQTQGSGFTGATLFYAVYSEQPSDGVPLESGIITGTSFTVQIPAPSAPQEIEIEAWAQSGTLGEFAFGDYELYEVSQINVQAGISTVSQYSDGSFQPGQTLTVTWSVQPQGVGNAPYRWEVRLWNANGWEGSAAPISVVFTGNDSGSLSYTIPSGSPAGLETVYVQVEAATYCNINDCEGVGQVSFDVNPSPSALNYELGAGSGLTVGWLILLVLIIVVALVLVLLMRRGRQPKSPASTYQASEPMNPPAPAPSSGPATEWKESPESSPGGSTPPAGSGDAQPPLPAPPPGAQ
jgi:hypothetical protein